jgi:hypothetical protein
VRPTITIIATIIALVLVAFGFYVGVYPEHDRALGSFLLLWALVVVWLGGVISSRAP